MHNFLTQAGFKGLRDERGFTLIEMAIVLIIIGIILGAVVKGKDVVKSAEHKRLYSSFVREWQVGFNNYYDRTGWILGDDDTDTNTARDGACGDGTTPATEANLNAQLIAVGLTAPAKGSTGATNVRTYTDSNGRQYAMTLAYLNNAAYGNYIQVSSTNGVPFDLGRAWDRIVDGSIDGTDGDLYYIPNTATPATNDDWPDANADAVTTSAIYLRLEF